MISPPRPIPQHQHQQQQQHDKKKKRRFRTKNIPHNNDDKHIVSSSKIIDGDTPRIDAVLNRFYKRQKDLGIVDDQHNNISRRNQLTQTTQTTQTNQPLVADQNVVHIPSIPLYGQQRQFQHEQHEQHEQERIRVELVQKELIF